MKISAKLRAWRRARGLSQSQAAPVLGITVRCLQAWEQGERHPRGLTLKHLEMLLNK